MSSTDRIALAIAVEEAAGTDETLYAGVPFAGEWKLTDAVFIPDTTTGADATDYVTLTVKQGSTTLASWSSAAAALTAGTAYPATLAGGAALEFGGNGADVATIANANTGSTGVAIKGLLHLGFVRLNKG